MNNWNQISSIVDRVLELNPDERTGFVNKVCKDDPVLKTSVTNFLKNIDSSEGLWEKMFESGSALADEITTLDVEFDTSPFHPPLEQAGPYKIIRHIARGGMGNVYLAERSDGQLNRKVAVKILRHELSSENYIRRFSSERNILSGLEHPNIARLYDVGVTEDNRPYLVMEYVNGLPVTTYCNDTNATLSEKLDLFRQVCKAVEFAHRNLIVHRDLKPDNILVKPDGTVKILDFGIAKIINDDLSPEMLVQTRENQQMLSLQYAAPEQVTLEKITTATDVYALGLLLYEIITGRQPFNMKRKNLKEAEQIIRFEEPKKPSTIIPDTRLARKVRGDLDAIILKAIRKEPDYRYVTADQLIHDISRYQTHLPVNARSESVRYHFSKFARRNKGVLSSLLLVVFIIFGFASFHLSEIEKQKDIALAGQQQAEFVTSYLTNLFQSASPTANQGDTLSVFKLLDIGKEGLSELDDGFRAKPNLLTAFADSYLNLGNYDEAIIIYKQAYEITRATHGVSEELAVSAIRIGKAYVAQRTFDKAILYFEEAQDIMDSMGGDFNHLRSGFLHTYGAAISEVGETERSIAILEEAMVMHAEHDQQSATVMNIKRALAKAYQHNERYEESEKLYQEILHIHGQNNDLYSTYNDLGYLMVLQDRPAEAVEYYLKSLDGHQIIYGENHPQTLMVMGNLAGAYADNEQHELAEYMLLQRIPIIRQRYGDEHWRVGAAIDGMGRYYISTNSFERAEEMFNQSVSIYKQALGPAHSWTVVTSVFLAYCKAVNGSTEESDSIFRESYATLSSNSAAFNYYEDYMYGRLLTFLTMHPMDTWHEEIALLEELMR